MAKQGINVFKEENKVIIEITEPGKELLKKIDELFGNAVTDLAGLLVPIDETTEPVQHGYNAAAKFVSVQDALLDVLINRLGI